MASAASRISMLQGIFYLGTGLWPIVHLTSFERVTGPKVDKWLVKTTGGLIAVIGATLFSGGRNGVRSTSPPLLGVTSALALAAADLVYVAKRRIPPVYAADAVLELAVAAGWLRALALRS